MRDFSFSEAGEDLVFQPGGGDMHNESGGGQLCQNFTVLEARTIFHHSLRGSGPGGDEVTLATPLNPPLLRLLFVI